MGCCTSHLDPRLQRSEHGKAFLSNGRRSLESSQRALETAKKDRSRRTGLAEADDFRRDWSMFVLDHPRVINSTRNIIGSFGHDFGAVETSADIEAIELTRKILRGAVSRARRTDIGKALSFLEASKYHNRVKEFLKIPELILQQRLRDDDTERAKHSDLLARMISSSDPYTGQKLSYDNIVHQCATFLLVGHDTTASFITWALYHIASDKTIERKIMKEARLTPIRALRNAAQLTTRALQSRFGRCWIQIQRRFPRGSSCPS